MKQNVLFVLLSACLCSVIACSKENNKMTINSHSLVGVWELRAEGGGWGPYQTFPAGNGYIVKFTEDAYETDSVSKVIKSGTYRIIKDDPLVVSGTTSRIIYDNNTNNLRSYISLSGDTLSFMIDAYDVGIATYIRISNDPGTIRSSK